MKGKSAIENSLSIGSNDMKSTLKRVQIGINLFDILDSCRHFGEGNEQTEPYSVNRLTIILCL